MKRSIFFAALVLALSGCAEARLIEEETKVTAALNVSGTSNLETQAYYSQRLSKAYQQAALRASRDQDALAFVTIVSALSVVGGALGSTSDKALANRATVGATGSLIGNRTLSKSTIKGIYISAKRMNCIATTASIGRYLLAEVGPNTKAAARAATFGAISEVQIISREALVRDVAEYSTIRSTLNTAISKSEAIRVNDLAMAKGADAKSFDLEMLNQYLKMLDNCLSDVATLTAIAEIETN